MSGIENSLKFEKIAEALAGRTPLPRATQATASGLNWLAAPSSSVCIGLAYRYIENSIETLRISESDGVQVINAVSLSAPVVNLAVSPDGRLVAACLSDGSLQCFDATENSLNLRWAVQGAHSHIVDSIENSANRSRKNAAALAGPVRSLQFSPTGYALALVDVGKPGLAIYHADRSNMSAKTVQNELSHLNVSCAAWSSAHINAECTISVGTSEGSIHIYKYDTKSTNLTNLSEIPYPEEGNEDDPAWSCTHIDFIENGSSLAVGYCRVIPAEDDDEEDEDEETDSAEHEVIMHMIDLEPGTLSLKESIDVGDCVPFFSVPRHGRHVFFTASIPVAAQQQFSFLMVTTNVGSEVAMIGRESGGPWEIIDVPEGSGVTTPVDDEDEFMYPTGMTSIVISRGNNTAIPCLLLAATDGSLTALRMVHGEDENFLVQPSSQLISKMPQSAVPVNEVSMQNPSEPELTEEPAAEVPSTQNNETAGQTTSSFPSTTPAPAFGGGSLSFGSSFGQPSTLGGGTTTLFGQPSTQSNSASFSAQPVFGQTASIFGTPVSTNKLSSFGTPAPAPINTPLFGSKTSAPIFGSGSSAPIFGSGTSTPFSGFAALAKSNESTGSGFAKTSQDSSPFDAFSKQNREAFSGFSFAKPLFASPTIPERQDKDSKKFVEEVAEDKEGESKYDESNVDFSKPSAIKAARAFDSMDKKGLRSLPVAAMGDLVDEVGEGFHGDELDKQISLVDPHGKGKIDRTAFISWYVELASGNITNEDIDEGSLDSEDKAEREEERNKAMKHFMALARNHKDKSMVSVGDFPKHFMSLNRNEQDKLYVLIEDFPKLFESLNTTYCEEEHSKTAKRLTKDGDRIYLKDFLDWYVAWLFGGDEETDDEEEDEEEMGLPCRESKDSSGVAALTATGGWGSVFQKKEGSWKCEICMVDNDADKTACAACETARPGHEKSVGTSKASAGSTTESGIGKGGFTFVGAVGGSSGKDAGGFSFGTTPVATKPTNFSSGSNVTRDSSSAQEQKSGFTFSLTTSEQKPAKPKTESKKGTFSFGTDESPVKKQDESKKSDVLSQTTPSYPPIASTAPTPFGSLSKPSGPTSSSSSAYPPLSSKGPTPFSSQGSRDSSTKPTSSSSYPPIASTAPTPFGSQSKSIAPISSSSDGYPPLSNKSPTPFSSQGGKDGSSKAASTSSFPPILSNAPTPFGSQMKSTASTSLSFGAYPPLPSKSPTPFSFQGSDDGNVKAPSGSSYPPIASTAPTPFGSQSKSIAPSSSSSSGYPPLSSKSPTPFSSQVSKDTSSEAVSSSSYPPIASTAPTPFGSQIKSSALSSSASVSYPPLSSKSPTPFSSQGSEDGSSKARSSSSHPPISSTAPTPFGSQGTSSEPNSSSSAFGNQRKSSASSSSSSGAYPPLSSKSPTPFSSLGSKDGSTNAASSSPYPAISSTGPTPIGSQSKSISTSSSSSGAYPPLSSKSPTPFSSQGSLGITKAASSSSYPPIASTAPTPFGSQNKSIAPSSSSSSSGYPPLSSKSPTPFTSQGGKDGSSKAASSSSFPPIASNAPTPFGSQMKSTAPTSLLFGAYPPLSSKSPTPFSSQGSKDDNAKAPSGSSYPPVASTAPTPFGSQSKSTAPSSSSSSGYPPLSSKSPTPFSSQGSKDASNKAVSSSSYPPIASTAPTPFGIQNKTVAPKASDSGSLASSSKTSDKHVCVDSTRGFRLDPSLSESSKQFINLVEKINCTITDIYEDHSEGEGLKMKQNIESLRNLLSRILTDCGNLNASAENCKSQCAQILGKKVEASRRTADSERLIGRLMSSDRDKLADVIETQPLDSESDERRRKLADQAMSTARLLEMTENRCSLMDSLATPEAEKAILFLLSNTYKRARTFSDDSSRIDRKLSNLSGLYASSIQRNRTAKGVPANVFRSSIRNSPLSEVSHEAKRNRLVHKWTSIESTFGSIKVPSRKHFEVGPKNILVFDASSDQDVKSNFRSSKHAVATRTPQPLFSSPPALTHRSGWDAMSTFDQTKAKRMSFNLPKELKETTLDSAARSALSDYGTSAEKIKNAINVNEIGLASMPVKSAKSTKQANSKLELQSEKKSSPRKSTTAAFPPLSTKAPVPVSERLTASNSSAKPSSQSAPSQSSAVPKSTPEEKTAFSSFSGMSVLGSSLQPSNRDGGDLFPKNAPTQGDSSNPDYQKLLTEFYQQHNPSKVSEVKKHLEKYQGQEEQMFEKLAMKYKVSNPLRSMPQTPRIGTGAPISSAPGPSFSSATPSPFLSTDKAQEQNQPPSFGAQSAASSASPFTSSQTSMNSPFGSTASGSGSGSMPAFGSSGLGTSSPFGQPGATNSIGSSPFGQSSMSMPTQSSFGNAGNNQMAASSTPQAQSSGTFAGRSPRDLLYNFYQQRNPSKLAEVDKLLAKYQGKEEQMFRNLAKKYNLDPSVFGLPQAPVGTFGSAPTAATAASSPGGFGQPSALGGGASFGVVGSPPAPSFGGTLGGGFGSSTGTGFGSTTGGSSGFGASSFGSLAQSSPGASSGFGSFGSAAMSSPFGSATPFGGPRR